MLLLILSAAVANAERWYYPDASDHMAIVDERFALTGAVLVEVPQPEDLPAHPAVVAVDWLTTAPPIARLQLRQGADDLRVSQELHQEDAVIWAHPDFALPTTTQAMPNDPLVGDQWYLENTGQTGSPGVDVNAETAWAFSTGAGQLIAIIDSGVDVAHPDLDAIGGYDYVDRDDDNYPANENAHGTACAGIAAGTGDNGIGIAGVAYGASVYGIRLLGGNTSLSDTYDSFVEAVDAGASVLNNSWGYSNACEGFSIPAALQRGIDYAEENGRDGLGSVVVFAAGNENCDVSGYGMLMHEAVVAVAAISRNDDRESYSSYGDPIDIAAPSGGLLTTDITGKPGYGDYNGDLDYTGGMSGTSAAAPVVSGVFGLMFAANPRLTAADAREVICLTATRNDIVDGEFNEDGWSRYYGCGRIDAGAAVAAVANQVPGAPALIHADIAYVDRVWLDWDPANDPDADHLSYRLQWWRDGAEDAPEERIVDELALELTGSVEAGDIVSWKVQAIDLWGDGPWSPTASVEIIDRPIPPPPAPEPTGGCQTAAGGLWTLAVLGLLGRRRRLLQQ